ncbi:MAG: cation diffusion facilitator family transporter [Hyphomicrobiaceae bacterium]
MASGSKTIIYAAAVGNAAIAVTKFGASAMTGSAAMLAEGIHSLVDTGNQILLLHGLRKAKFPPDSRFPFGHGKEIYFWSFIVSILIFAVGAGVSLYEGVIHLMHPVAVTDAWVNYTVLSIAIVFEGGAWWMAMRHFNEVRGELGWVAAVRNGKDPTLFVVLFEDSAALLGLAVAMLGVFLGQYTGNPIWDAVATVAIGLILGGTAIWLAYETKSLLIGEGASPEVVDSIREIVLAAPRVDYVNEVLTLHMGPEFVLLNVSVTFGEGVVAGEIEESIRLITKRVRDRHPVVKRVFVEAEALHGGAGRGSSV